VKVIVRITNNFRSELKPLIKKYHSISNDLLKLESELIQNPRLGTSLGKDVFKIRLKITSKGKGKSGGARVITLVESDVIAIREQTSPQEITINLLSIYDKSHIGNISDKEIKELIKSFHNQSK
jgi:hypothetical protein